MKGNRIFQDERTQKKAGLAALLCWLVSIIYLTVSMIIKLIRDENAIYELLHLLIIITIFCVISKDWKEVSLWRDFFGKPIGEDKFGKRIKAYLADSAISGLIYSVLDLILRTINPKIAFIQIETDGSFYAIVSSLLFEALFVFIIYFLLTLITSENKVSRYKKQQKRIQKEENEEKGTSNK